MHTLLLQALLGSNLPVKNLAELSGIQLRQVACDLKAALCEIECESGYRESVESDNIEENVDAELHDNKV